MLRGIIIVDNATAKEIGSNAVTRFESPQLVYTEINGVYPVSPQDIRDNWDNFDIGANDGIVEIMCKPGKHSTISEIKREDIISVNLHAGDGLFYPYRMFKPYCMFSKDTNIFTDELGWKFPMDGISWIRNRQCMSSAAYTHMMEKLSNRQGAIIVEYIEKLFQTSLLPLDIIAKYNLWEDGWYVRTRE